MECAAMPLIGRMPSWQRDALIIHYFFSSPFHSFSPSSDDPIRKIFPFLFRNSFVQQTARWYAPPDANENNRHSRSSLVCVYYAFVPVVGPQVSDGCCQLPSTVSIVSRIAARNGCTIPLYCRTITFIFIGRISIVSFVVSFKKKCIFEWYRVSDH